MDACVYLSRRCISFRYRSCSNPCKKVWLPRFKTLSGKAKLTEANMREGLALVQQALLEADVSYPVVKDFMASVSEQAIGEQVLKSLNPEPASCRHRPPGAAST